MGINFQPIYILASGAERAKDKLDTTSNNLANVNTPGFKKIILREMSQNIPNNPKDAKELFTFVRFNDTPVILEQGSLKKTERNLDLAIQGDGFFTIRDSAGNTFLTRNGHFFVDPSGTLIDQNNNLILDQNNNPITIDPTKNITITKDGTIYQNNTQIAKLQILTYQSVNPVGNSYYTGTGNPIPPKYQIHQGFLENSNTNSIKEMINLIEAHRRFDIYGNLMRALDQLEQKTHEIGRA
ncbi:MAG: flagellar hook-basal body protein [Aquificae bacterium]|nr:flagellar hook-basal body protein [Aquificota bacterium]